MRKHTLWMGALAIGALALGCGGNRDNGTQGAAGTSGSTDVSGGRTMTLRGCVEAGSPGGTYVLRSIASETASGTSGSSGGSGAGSDVNGINQQNDQTYRLIATGNLDIGRNIGKEVSVTGELANRAQDNSGPAGTAGSAGDRTRRQGTSGQGSNGTDLQSGGSEGSGNGRVQGSAADDRVGGQFFRVTSMTKVSDSCPTSGR